MTPSPLLYRGSRIGRRISQCSVCPNCSPICGEPCLHHRGQTCLTLQEELKQCSYHKKSNTLYQRACKSYWLNCIAPRSPAMETGSLQCNAGPHDFQKQVGWGWGTWLLEHNCQEGFPGCLFGRGCGPPIVCNAPRPPLKIQQKSLPYIYWTFIANLWRGWPVIFARRHLGAFCSILRGGCPQLLIQTCGMSPSALPTESQLQKFRVPIEYWNASLTWDWTRLKPSL